MKSYICDICEKPITDPYRANMREFRFAVTYEFGFGCPTEEKTRTKIHLCGDCFDELKQIAMRRNGGLYEKQHSQENDI